MLTQFTKLKKIRHKTLFFTIFLILSVVRCTEDSGFNGYDFNNNLPKSESTDYALSEPLTAILYPGKMQYKWLKNHFRIDTEMADRTAKEKNLTKFQQLTIPSQMKRLYTPWRLCGSAMSSNYGVFSTCNTSTHPNDIGDGLDGFGYTHDGKGDLDDRYDQINLDLQNGYPVILSGAVTSLTPWENWHIWLADGYKHSAYWSWTANGNCGGDPHYGSSPASCGVCPDCVDCHYIGSREWHMSWG